MNLSGRAYRFLDLVLDRAVVPGYSALGYRVRHHAWTGDPLPHSMSGKTVMVTGANSGIGKAIAGELGALGATVLMVSRNAERGERAREELAANNGDADLRVEVCDIADLSAVRNFASDLRARVGSLDVIVHNAGLLPDERSETADGHEITLATHVLGPVLLTELLVPALAGSPDPRVILMSSGGMYTQALAVDDPEYRDGTYRGATAYARTKRMQVAFTPLLAQRWNAQGISVYCMHPGWSDTPGVATSLPGFRKLAKPLLRTTEQGADTAVWLAATQPAEPTGRFWHDRRQRPEHYLPFTRNSNDDVERLWGYCRQAVGLTDS